MKPIPIRTAAPAPRAPAESAIAPVDSRWRLARLLTAPHRLGFFSAALMLATGGLWWALVLGTRQAGVALPWAVPPPLAHALFMAMGFMPLFIVGFLFTAGPRWLGLPDVDARSLRWPVSSMLGGWAVALPGFHVHAGLAALGVALVAIGWSAIVWRFAGLLRKAPVADKLHATVIAVATAAGAVALWAAAAALALADVTVVRVATQVALWACLVPTFVTVSHRMIPFFTASALPFVSAWRPNALLWALLAVPAVLGVGAVADLLWWPLPAAWRWGQAGVESLMAVLALGLALRWGLVQSLRIRLLAMLHGGFLWLGLATLLAALSHGLMAFGGQGLGLACLHAITMGYLGATLIAMITRVAAGHSGRALAADNLAWGLYWVLQTATVLRVAAELWLAAYTPLILLAVTAWACATTAWAWRYGGWLGRPRADGRPG